MSSKEKDWLDVWADSLQCFVCLALNHPLSTGRSYTQGIAMGSLLSAGQGITSQDDFRKYLQRALCKQHFDEIDHELCKTDSFTRIDMAFAPPLGAVFK